MDTPKKEHEWLQRFLGEWQATGESPATGDQPASTWTSTERFRQIGPLWLQSDAESTMPDGTPASMQLTLGYNSQRQKFVGTWLGSMMDFLWVYEGELSSDGNTLTLNTQGPDMSEGQPGPLTPYRDIHVFVDDRHRILRSEMQDASGNWVQFMEVDYYRQ